MTVEVDRKRRTTRPHNLLRSVCAVGVSAAIVAAGMGTTQTSETRVNQLVHLEATLAGI